MSFIFALVDHVAPDWQLLAWAAFIFVVIALIATLMWRTRKPKSARRKHLGNDAEHDSA